MTPQNLRAMDKRVKEYAEKGDMRGVARIIGGSPRADLGDYTPADEGMQWTDLNNEQ